MAGHHLVLGTLTDRITGETLEDTLDERYRQRIADLLIDRLGFRPEEIRPRAEVRLRAGDRRAIVRLDFLVTLADRPAMVIRFGPGSIVSRERPALSFSRLVGPFQVPVAVATNGEDAAILDGATGRLLGRGLAAIPSRAELARILEAAPPAPISPERAERESRIAYCYEVDGACPCDDTICRLEPAPSPGAGGGGDPP
ncbi:MAG: type I restriction enzyme HsdR N-terminal domain-containing protein [Desulfobacterales bacterium]